MSQKFIARERFEFSAQLESAVDGYFEAMQFTTENGDYSKISKAERQKARARVGEFIEACGELFGLAIAQPGYNAQRFGNDIWFSMTGAGVGFWDRDELQIPIKSPIAIVDRYGVSRVSQGETMADVLTEIAYGNQFFISKFAYPSASVERGYIYVD